MINIKIRISSKSLFFCAIVMFNCLPLLAQKEHFIKGTVTDGSQPLQAISIYESSHPSNGTITDANGMFFLHLINLKDSLIISGVGYRRQSILADTSSALNIILKSESNGLNDVVVVGYGQKQKAITLTGAVSSVSGEVIRQSPAASLQNALAGRLPGLFAEQRSGQPGNDASQLQIRGISTYNSPSSQQPLLLVDDIVTSYSQLSQIDPNQVESVTILKDASTTAIYGVRGANGVIIVTTRRGQAGRPELTVTNETALQIPTNLPTLNSGYTTLRLLNEYTLQQGLNPGTLYPQFFSGNSLDYYKNNSDPYGHPDVDWWKTLMRNVSPQDRINMNVGGGSRKIRYNINLGYITQGGIFKNFTKGQGYNGNYFNNRYDFRSNIDINPTKSLHIREDLSGTFQITNSPNDLPWNNGGNTFEYLWNQQLSSFLYPLYNPDGSLGNVLNPQNSGATKPNPVANLTYSGYKRAFDYNINSVTAATQQLDFITKGLSLNALVSYQSDYQFQKSLTRSASQILTYYYNAANGTYRPATTNLYRNGPLSRSSSPQGTSQQMNLQASLNYSRDFGNNHFDGMFLYQRNTQTANSSSTGGIPGNTLSIPLRIDYNFKEKYIIQVDATYSGSDRFGNGKQFGLFPAISAGWNIAKESFFKNSLPFINEFKLRASYGLTGSDNIGGYKYLYQSSYSGPNSNDYYFGATSNPVSGVSEGALGNTNITWEKDRKTDIGTDIKMFNNSLSITADYFHDYRYDILSARQSAPSVIGVGLPILNLGKVENQGYEVEVKYNGKAGAVTYFVDGQVSFAKNKILFMDEPAKPYPWLAQTGNSIGAVFGYTWTGKYYQNISDLFSNPMPTNGVPLKNIFPGGLILKDLNGDGVLDKNDQGYLGTNQPQYTAGLSFGVSYKSFDLSVLLNGSFDYVINMQRGLTNYMERSNYASIPYVLGRWTPENASSATYPALDGGITSSVSSSFWYHSGNYIRLKNVEIGYLLPSSFAKRLHLKSFRVYASGYDLGLIYNALPVPIDPESVVSSSVGEYPQERIVNLGVTIGL